MTNDPVDGQISRLGPFTKNHFAAPPWNFLVEKKKKKKFKYFPFHAPSSGGLFKSEDGNASRLAADLFLFLSETLATPFIAATDRTPAATRAARASNHALVTGVPPFGAIDLYFDWIFTIFFGILIKFFRKLSCKFFLKNV